jgi:16S rRNA (guanine527-N7)-methyltransferase
LAADRAAAEAAIRAQARLDRLADRYSLPPDAAERLMSLVALIHEDPHAPTSVLDWEGVVDDHVADSLVALELDVVRDAQRLADLGAGAGFPGLPLAVALPDTQVTLVESSARKCRFLTSAAAASRTANAAVANARVEAWDAGLGSFDVVTARALASLAVVAEYAAPLLGLGGTLVVWRGQRDPVAEAQGARAAAELGLEVQAPRHVRPYPGAQHRYLHQMVKRTETPARFPRRAGVAVKRPLGG